MSSRFTAPCRRPRRLAAAAGVTLALAAIPASVSRLAAEEAVSQSQNQSQNLAADSGAAVGFYSFFKAAPANLAASLGVAPWADAMTKGQAAYGRGEFAAARGYFETASAQGDIIATWYLGHIYRLGRGVDADPGRAFQYYTKVVEAFSADESDPQRLRVMIDALVRVADTYRIGDAKAKIAANPRQAFAMYNTAASFGHPAAHYALGLMSLAGLGVKQNTDQGMKWLMLAARKRYAPAEAALGDLFWKGEVVPQDRIRGMMWYMLAEQTAQPEEHPEIFDRLDGIIAAASDPERLEAQTRAKLWAEKYPVIHAAAGLAED